MAIFDTSDIKATGFTVTGVSTLSGNSNNAILTISGSSNVLLTVNDTTGSTNLFTVSTTAGTQNFAVTNTGISATTISGISMNLGAGTATTPPLQLLTGGTVVTTPVTGSFELDNININYYTYAPSSRGVNRNEQILILTGTSALSSATTSQALFSAATIAGSLNILAGYTYGFECGFDLSGMSASIGTFGFGLSGTSVLSSLRYTAIAGKAVTGIANPSTIVTLRNRATTAISSASTATAGFAQIDGIFRCTTSGTIVPHTLLSVASSAVVAQDSYFKVFPMGSNTLFKIGNWI